MKSIELRNGRFVDVENGRYFEAGTGVILEGGRIKALMDVKGQPAHIKGDIIIDLRGMAVIPGIFNTHCHIQMTFPSMFPEAPDILKNELFSSRQKKLDMQECLSRGITNIRDAWTDDLRLNNRLKDKISKGKLPGPRIYQSVLIGPEGGSFSRERDFLTRLMYRMKGLPTVKFSKKRSGVISFNPSASTEEIRHLVDRAVYERGADTIKIYEQRDNPISGLKDNLLMTMKQLEALVDQARVRGIPTTMHHTTIESFRRGVDAGVTSFAHLSFDELLTKADIDKFIKANCILEPTLSIIYHLCWEALSDELSNQPLMAALNELRNKTYRDFAKEFWVPSLGKAFEEGMRRFNNGNFKLFGKIDGSSSLKPYAKLISIGTENLVNLFNSGAVMACGNDGGAVACTMAAVQNEFNMFELLLKDRTGVKDFNGSEAVKVATLNSAKALGLEKDFGSITPGKVADLVVIDGDPLKDYKLIGKRAAAVFKAGELVARHGDVLFASLS